MKKITFLLLVFIVASCGHYTTKSSIDGVKVYENLGFSGDQSDRDFKVYKDAGYERIVNIRQIGEENYPLEQFEKEKAQIEELGLEFHHVPFTRESVANQNIETSTMEQITAAVRGEDDSVKTLIYCSSGARASSWMAWYLHEKHGFYLDESLQHGASLGPGDKNHENALYAIEQLLKMSSSRD